MTQLSRRTFLRTVGLTGGAAVLAACGGAPAAGDQAASGGASAPAQSSTPITLTVWNSDWGKDYNDPMIRLSDAFTKDLAPNVKVEWTFVPKMTEKLAAAIAAGNPPDVAIIDEGYGIPKMAKVGGIVSLDQYFAADGIKQADFIPFTWETVLYKGKPYGVPGGAGTNIIMYDKAVFKEAGIDPASVPDTPSWNQFVDWNQKLVKKDASGKIVRLGTNPDAGGFSHFAGILGFQYYNADKTKIAVNTPESVKAVEQWASLLPQGVPYADITNLIAGAPNSAYGTLGGGKVGMIWDGYWAFLGLDKYWPKMDYGMAKLPTPHGSKDEWKLYTGWVWNAAIPKGAKYPDQAWQFIKYGFWNKGAMLADTLNWTSALSQFPDFEQRTLAVMGASNREKPYLHHFSEVQYAGQYFIPYTPIHQKLLDGLGQAIDATLRGTKPAQDALDEVATTLQPELDKNLS